MLGVSIVLLCKMYNKSNKAVDEIEVLSHDINLRDRGKVKMKKKKIRG